MAPTVTRLTSSGTYYTTGIFDDASTSPILDSSLQVLFDAGNPRSYSGSGTTWYDISGNGYVATLTNTPVYTTSTGYFSFNGTNQYASTSYLQPAYQTSDSFTWNIWISTGLLNTAMTIGNRNYSSSPAYDFTKIDNNLNFEYFHSGTNVSVAPTSISTNTWYNVCIVKNTGTISHYVNGVFNNSTSASQSSSNFRQAFWIGGDPGAGEYGNARISVVSIYNRALVLDEIRQNFNSLAPRFGVTAFKSSATHSVTSTTIYAPQLDEVTGMVVTNGLVAYLDAGKSESYAGTGTVITDLSNINVNARMNGTVTWVNSGTASYFNFPTAGDSNYITSSISQAYRDVTIVFQPDFTLVGGSSIAGLIAINTNTSTYDKSLRFRNVNGTGPWQIPQADGNDWNSTATNTATYYLNGNTTTYVSLGYVNLSPGWNVLGVTETNMANFPNTFPYYIGASGYPGRGFQGKIAAVLLYNRPLSQAEQIQNYNYFASRYGLAVSQPTAAKRETTSSLIVSGGFDEVTGIIITNGLQLYLDGGNVNSYARSGVTWNDLSNSAYSGQMTNISYTSTSSGLVFASGSYANLTPNCINSNADFTISFWCNPTANAAGTPYTLLASYSVGGSLQIRFLDNAVNLVKNYVANIASFTGFTATINTNYYITVQLVKSTNTWILYVNGTYVSNFVSSQSFNINAPAIGTNLGGGESFIGTIFSVSCYNRVLTAAEIAENFNQSRGRFGV